MPISPGHRVLVQRESVLATMAQAIALDHSESSNATGIE
jgi:hypothetical protein